MPNAIPIMFAVPAGLTDEESVRLHALAKALHGRHATKPPAYYFTPERCRKFKLLFSTGFTAGSSPGDRIFFMHPSHARSFQLRDAVLLAGVMEKAAPQPEEAPV